MRVIADVHGASGKLRSVARDPGPLLILGDLINFVDYRTYQGIVADVCGIDFVAKLVRLRTAGDIAGAHRLWEDFSGDRQDEIRAATDRLVDEQYREVCAALGDVEAYLTYGNADRPDRLVAHLPSTARFVDGEVIELGGVSVGLVGGGLPLRGGIGVPGEVTEEELEAKLALLGPVDVLCTHVPPAIRPLETDVVGGRQKGSRAVLAYLLLNKPPFHYFGDVHQPQAVDWTVAATRCRNVGYFRATGRAFYHDSIGYVRPRIGLV